MKKTLIFFIIIFSLFQFKVLAQKKHNIETLIILDVNALSKKENFNKFYKDDYKKLSFNFIFNSGHVFKFEVIEEEELTDELLKKAKYFSIDNFEDFLINTYKEKHPNYSGLSIRVAASRKYNFNKLYIKKSADKNSNIYYKVKYTHSIITICTEKE